MFRGYFNFELRREDNYYGKGGIYIECGKREVSFFGGGEGMCRRFGIEYFVFIGLEFRCVEEVVEGKVGREGGVECNGLSLIVSLRVK